MSTRFKVRRLLSDGTYEFLEEGIKEGEGHSLIWSTKSADGDLMSWAQAEYWKAIAQQWAPDDIVSHSIVPNVEAGEQSLQADPAYVDAVLEHVRMAQECKDVTKESLLEYCKAHLLRGRLVGELDDFVHGCGIL